LKTAAPLPPAFEGAVLAALFAVVAAAFSAAFSAPGAAAEGNAKKGRAVAEKYCSRCHVVGRHNPMGGIGSTASFQMIAKMPDFLERFETFYARRPHPAFLNVPGVKRWSKQPGYATEFTITLEQVEDIVAFARTLEKVPIKRARRKRTR